MEARAGAARGRSVAAAALRTAAVVLLPVAAVELAARAGLALTDVRPVMLVLVACVAAGGGVAETVAAVLVTIAYGIYFDRAGHPARSPLGPAGRAAVYVACAAATASVVLGLAARARRRSARVLGETREEARRDGESQRATGAELNRVILSSLPAHIAVIDAHGTIITTNGAWDGFARENGAPLPAGSGIGANYLSVCRRAGGPEARQAREVADGIEAVLRGERGEFRLEYPCHAPDRQRWFLLTVTPLDAGARRGAVISHFDITDRKLSEEAMTRRAAELAQLTRRLKKSNDELDQFAYITSHDLRAPLRGIANLSRWIEEDMGESFTPDAHRQMELLRGRVSRMEAMIDGILEYSRVGRVRQKVERVDVAGLLAEVIELLDVPTTFTVDVHAGMPVIVGERLRLQQVFMNLVANAIKHHDRPDGRITVTCADPPAGGDHPGMVEFAVADDGPGIEPQYHEKVFMIFQTLEARDKVEGTGVGLSLVRKIIESEGGTIRLESEKGKGATFRFTWHKKVEARAAEGDGQAVTVAPPAGPGAAGTADIPASLPAGETARR
jgi:signal transduction histidine kinase